MKENHPKSGVEVFQLKIHKCSEEGENPTIVWITQKAMAGKNAPEKSSSASSGEYPALPIFRYKNEHIFPNFCNVRKI